MKLFLRILDSILSGPQDFLHLITPKRVSIYETYWLEGKVQLEVT